MIELSDRAKDEMRRLAGTAWSFTPLPDALWEQMPSNPELRNAIAGANEQWREIDCVHVAWIAQVYPQRYAVSLEQIQAAKAQLEADKQAAITRLKGSSTLLMVDMGSLLREVADADEIDSYRLRGCFRSPQGKHFLLEVSSRDKERDATGPMYCSEFEELDLTKNRGENYSYLKHADLGAYSKSNLLNLVNKHFGCHFTVIEIDHYTLRSEDYSSISPS